jgi:hypothetical protein
MHLLLCAFLMLGADSSSKPGTVKPKWELAPLERLFRIVSTSESGKTVRWTLALREGTRTSEFVTGLSSQPFTFLFFDEDNKELDRVVVKKADFLDIPKDRIMKAGTRLRLTLEVPASAAGKSTKITLKRGKVD